MHHEAPGLLMNGEPLAAAAPLVEWQAVEFACLPPAGVALPGASMARTRTRPSPPAIRERRTRRCVDAASGERWSPSAPTRSS